MMDRKIAGAIGLIGALAVSVSAQKESTGTRIADFLTIGGEVRARYEILNGFDANRSTEDDNDMIFMRSRIGFDFDITEKMAARFSLQDQRRFGDYVDGPAGVAAPNAPRLAVGSNSSNLRDVADIVLREGYIEFNDLWNGRVDYRIGRQAIVKGDERVFGEIDWHSFGGITHDALVSTFRPWEGHSWDFITIAVEENDNLPTAAGNGTANGDRDAYLYGVYGDIKWKRIFERFQPYYVFESYDSVIVGTGRLIPQATRAENLATGSNQDDYKAHTAGLLVSGKIGSRIDWAAEGNYQWGDFGIMDLDAYMLHGKLGLALPAARLDKIALMYDIYSGDKTAGDREMNTYQPIFPSFHEHTGRMAWFGMKNVEILRAAATGKFIGSSRWRFDFFHFRRNEDQDHFWETDGTRWFGGNPAFDDELANQYELELTWPWRENVDLLLSYSRFEPEKGMRQALGASGRTPDNADNVIAQVTVKF